MSHENKYWKGHRKCNKCHAAKPVSEFPWYERYQRYGKICRLCRSIISSKNNDGGRLIGGGFTGWTHRRKTDSQYVKCMFCGDSSGEKTVNTHHNTVVCQSCQAKLDDVCRSFKRPYRDGGRSGRKPLLHGIIENRVSDGVKAGAC